MKATLALTASQQISESKHETTKDQIATRTAARLEELGYEVDWMVGEWHKVIWYEEVYGTTVKKVADQRLWTFILTDDMDNDIGAVSFREFADHAVGRWGYTGNLRRILGVKG